MAEREIGQEILDGVREIKAHKAGRVDLRTRTFQPLESADEISEAWWEELQLRNPRFKERIAQARGSLREGQGITIEELREKYDINSQATREEE